MSATSVNRLFELTSEEVADLPELDLGLLQDLVRWAEGDNAKFKDVWEQNSYGHMSKNGVCQTAFCIAGQAVAQTGRKILWTLETYDVPMDDRTHYYASMTEDGDSISDLGAEIIGLAEDEASALFDGDNEIQDVRQIAQEICTRRGLVL